jgi:hypothetical protein
MVETKDKNKKIKEDITVNLDKKKIRQKQNRQVMFAVIMMISIILITILIPIIKKNFIDKFNYGGFNFQKTMVGQIKFYSTEVPIFDNQGKIIRYSQVYFVNDPRTLEYIDTDLKQITFKKANNTIYISIAGDSPRCENNIVAPVGLKLILKEISGNLKIIGALDDEVLANETKIPFITCENSPYNTVIYLKQGESNQINKTADNCYELVYKDCEILKVTEKFSIEVLKDYIDRFKVK